MNQQDNNQPDVEGQLASKSALDRLAETFGQQVASGQSSYTTVTIPFNPEEDDVVTFDMFVEGLMADPPMIPDQMFTGKIRYSRTNKTQNRLALSKANPVAHFVNALVEGSIRGSGQVFSRQIHNIKTGKTDPGLIVKVRYPGVNREADVFIDAELGRFYLNFVDRAATKAENFGQGDQSNMTREDIAAQAANFLKNRESGRTAMQNQVRAGGRGVTEAATGNTQTTQTQMSGPAEKVKAVLKLGAGNKPVQTATEQVRLPEENAGTEEERQAAAGGS